MSSRSAAPRAGLVKKIVFGLGGGLLLVAGVALLVLPGPGLLLVLAGLILLAVGTGLVLIAAGVVWGLYPTLPLGGWATGVGLIISGLILLGLLVVSHRRVQQGRRTGTG